MAVLIDPPRWPAHGTLWGHLVSDSSLVELHDFADLAGLPARGFDHDHYDVPEARYEELVGLGATPVAGPELVRRLLAGGLRVHNRHRKPKREQVLPALRDDWERLLPGRSTLGERLLERWSEPHRHYHDVRHLHFALKALDLVAETTGRSGSTEPQDRPVRLALWFHDAVYEGVAGADEEASAQLAEAELVEAGVGPGEAAEVARLVRQTATHAPEPGDVAAERLADADLAILGALPGRYDVYVRDVRLEYPQLDDETFRQGRLRVVRRLAEASPLYRTTEGQGSWYALAAVNLEREAGRLARGPIRLHPDHRA